MSKAFVQVILLSSVALISGQQPRSCNLSSCNGQPHTLCIYPSTSPAASCGQVGPRGMTQDEKNTVLNRHNQWRAYVANGQESRGAPGPQPAATNMGALVWNDEIAEIAQRWADQCTFAHDKCRNTANNMAVGQNVAYLGGGSTWPNNVLSQMVDNWYNEVKDFDNSLVASYQMRGGPATGHYTQIVWAGTTMVGCGVTRYRKPGQAYNVYLVCNYAPGGNIIGTPIYETN